MIRRLICIAAMAGAFVSTGALAQLPANFEGLADVNDVGPPSQFLPFHDEEAGPAECLCAHAAHRPRVCGKCGHGTAQCGCEVCWPTVEEVTEEKSCWKVECDKVCVPAVRFPWEPGSSGLTLFSWMRPHGKGCGQESAACSTSVAGGCDGCFQPKCGYVRGIHVLTDDSFEVTSCRCTWEIRRLPPCSCANSDSVAAACGTICQPEMPADDATDPLPLSELLSPPSARSR